MIYPPRNTTLELLFIIEFEAKLDHNMEGCYLSTYMHNGEEKCLVATQFESHYARQAFPCIDEPAAKATFRLKIELEDAHSEDIVLSNMPCHNIYGNTYAFACTPVMSTYLLAWVAGPLQSVSTINKNGTKVSSYCALNQPLESLLLPTKPLLVRLNIMTKDLALSIHSQNLTKLLYRILNLALWKTGDLLLIVNP